MQQVAPALSFVTVVLVAVAAAQEAPRADAGFVTRALQAPRLRPERVLYDTPGDGELWALGSTYKACFTDRAFTYIPFFGSDAPRNFPVTFTVESVRIGERLLAVRPEAAPHREGDRVTYDRGSLREVYRLTPRGVEQVFEVTDAEADGELVVTLRVQSELVGAGGSDGVQFAHELGRVDYGQAFVVTAGQKQPIASAFADGRLAMTVKREQRQGHAAVTIDPWIATWSSADPNNRIPFFPDVAFDALTGLYVVTWMTQWSQADDDVVSELWTRDGQPILGSKSYIDFTSLDWWQPHVATLPAWGQCLVVATRYSNGTSEIAGRARAMDATAVRMSNIITVSGPQLGQKTTSDIGGDPSWNANLPAQPTWTVAYTRVYSSTDTDVHARRVRWNPVTQQPQADGSTIFVDNSSATRDYVSTISKCCGAVDRSAQRSLVTWSRLDPNNRNDTFGAILGPNGAVTRGTFAIHADPDSDYFPLASSMIEQDGGRYFLVVSQRYDYQLLKWNMFGKVVADDGTEVVPLTDLSYLLGSGVTERSWALDSDGTNFCLLYAEHGAGGVYYAVVPIAMSNGGLEIVEAPQYLPTGPLGTSWPIAGLCCDFSGGGSPARCHAVVSELAAGWHVTGAIAEFGGGQQRMARSGVNGCGGIDLRVASNAAPGGAIVMRLAAAEDQAHGLLLGVPHPGVQLCGSCTLGLDPLQLIACWPQQVRVDLRLPNNPLLSRMRIAVQGYELGAGGCGSGAGPRLSPSVALAIR